MFSSNFYVYDCDLNTLTALPSPPSASTITEGGLGKIGDYIYMISGYDSFNGIAVSRVVRYSITNNTWATVSVSIPSDLPRRLASCVSVGDTIYVMCGTQTANTAIYKFKDNQFTKLADIPQYVSTSGSALLEDWIICVGGLETPSISSTITNQAQCYVI
jgi:hypothetical protein